MKKCLALLALLGIIGCAAWGEELGSTVSAGIYQFFSVDTEKIIDPSILESIEGGRYDEGKASEAFSRKLKNEKRPIRENDERESRRLRNDLVKQLTVQDQLIKTLDDEATNSCHFLVLLAGPQLDSGRVFTPTEIVRIKNDLIKNGLLEKDYNVLNYKSIVDYAARLVGYNSGVDAGDYSKLELRYIAQRGITENKNPHFTLCDSEGRFFWDPFYGDKNRNVVVEELRPIRYRRGGREI